MAVAVSPCLSSNYNDHFSTISRGSSEVTNSSQPLIPRSYAHSRNGRSSPSHSAHGCLMRTSLRKLCREKKARKIHIFINADRFFKGIPFAVSSERFRSFESLLEELTRLLSEHQANLPKGVRIIFNKNGAKVTAVEELLEGHDYICSSSEPFKNIEYSRNENKTWCMTRKLDSTTMSPSSYSLPRSSDSSPYSTPSLSMENTSSNRNFIRPRLITVIRNGIRPRKAVRILLNKKTAHSFDQVLSDITESIKLDTGAVRKVFTLDGKQVSTLEDFFKDADIFIAYGQERYSHDDFDLDCDECKYLSVNVTPLASRKERFCSFQSPLARRRVLSTKNESNKVQRTSLISSPKSNLRIRPRSALQLENDQHEANQRYPPRVSGKFDIGRVIGDGNFAVVRQCCDKITKKEYAIKIIDKEKCRGKEHMIASEVLLMKKIKHPNIVSLYFEFDFPTELYLVLGLVKGGDLFDALMSVSKFSEDESKLLVYDLMQAISFLHSIHIVHRDIKPENLLVDLLPDGSKVLKLADFGLAMETHEVLYTICGTPTYVAPEILAETGYGLKVDVWAAGVIMFILLCGYPPFGCNQDEQESLFNKILAGHFEFIYPYWENVSYTAQELITNMLEVNVKSRLSADEVLGHPWLQDARPAKHRNQHHNDHHMQHKPSPLLKNASSNHNPSFIPVRKVSCR